MGRTLRMEVIAEGIEDEAQAEVLAASRCEVGQGFLFARPLAPSDFLSFTLERSLERARVPEVRSL